MLLKNGIERGPSDPVRMFVSYAHEDRAYLDRLRIHLTLLIREGTISVWADQAIAAGDDWRENVKQNLQSANVILFLLSADFFASDFIWNEEMKSALARHKAGEAVVVPILVRPVEWQTAPFAFIQMLPEGCLPISAWPDPEQGFAAVTHGIRDLIRNLDRSTIVGDRGDIKGSAIRVGFDIRSIKEDFCRSELLLFPSGPFKPPTMKGIAVPRRRTLGSQHFIFDWGDLPEGKRDESERQRLLRYFRACLTVEDRDQWVNLSAYESNQMIPDELKGTLLGHDLLQFDCDLKRLSVTMVYPEFETGAKYWKVLNERLTAEFANVQVVHSFQKVTLLPSNASIYSPEGNQELSDVFLQKWKWLRAEDYLFAYALENELSLLCREDEEALNHNAASGLIVDIQTAAKVNKVAIQTFKDIAIPVMEHEIRFGSSFARVRQIYSAMLLATWIKRQQAERRIDIPGVDAGTHLALNLPFYKIAGPAGIYGLDQEGITGPDPIDDDRDFYAEYLDLFKRGIYQNTRRQYDPVLGGFVTRVYSSGAFNHYGSMNHQTWV